MATAASGGSRLGCARWCCDDGGLVREEQQQPRQRQGKATQPRRRQEWERQAVQSLRLKWGDGNGENGGVMVKGNSGQWRVRL
ncbi:hypothetical protein SESBI_01678 [Sesbania bispinosa]|nr:hypothetical protein SESBI_01678 [Sesbania bispinosa]